MEEDKKELIEVEKVENTQDKKEEKKVEATQTQEPKKEKKGFSIASLVLGIVALVFFCMWYISIPCAILAIIFGILGCKSKENGMAIAGLITGSIGFVISILLVMAIFTFGLVIGLSDTLEEIDYEDDYDYGIYEDYDLYE